MSLAVAADWVCARTPHALRGLSRRGLRHLTSRCSPRIFWGAPATLAATAESRAPIFRLLLKGAVTAYGSPSMCAPGTPSMPTTGIPGMAAPGTSSSRVHHTSNATGTGATVATRTPTSSIAEAEARAVRAHRHVGLMWHRITAFGLSSAGAACNRHEGTRVEATTLQWGPCGRSAAGASCSTARSTRRPRQIGRPCARSATEPSTPQEAAQGECWLGCRRYARFHYYVQCNRQEDTEGRRQ